MKKFTKTNKRKLSIPSYTPEIHAEYLTRRKEKRSKLICPTYLQTPGTLAGNCSFCWKSSRICEYQHPSAFEFMDSIVIHRCFTVEEDYSE